MNNNNQIQLPKTILGHPNSLFVLFFTEMWERFSYYGMRALLVLFLISETAKGGWGWSRADATSLYGLYTMLVYFTPILGGYLADRYLGTRRAVVLGGFIIAAGHVSLFFETVPSFYLGLALVIAGTGLFKPNISAIVGQLYNKDNEGARDGGYTLFYMGVNAGAFFGISLCGYIGEKVSWNLGFGLAGVFMILGALQFFFSQGIFGDIGAAPKREQQAAQPVDDTPAHVVADRLKAIFVFAFFTIFFWFAFEQAGGSMTIFAADYTDRTLVGTSGLIFKVVNSLMTVIPAAILTWLLWQLHRSTGSSQLTGNLLLVLAFALIWGLVIWMLGREFAMAQSEVPATWFGVLNSFFLVILAPMFSKMWEKHWNPSGPVKFGVGLVLLGLGFAALAYGAAGIPSGAKTAQISMLFLCLAYLLHTMGELCVSPVGLSYISKLAPARLLGLMFGVWFLNSAVANFIGGKTGSYIDYISTTYSMSTFFLIFTFIPAVAGVVLMLLTPWMTKKMHGVH
ncbi:POT family proton-dependent oligopeptide transporter [Paucibacter oligotrophus]|uniref:POT family proton-dependent oligopeptide transporter n=1 Tax=Roseateles oligotrophus TaxID=1769250 RepID=A0A840L4G1_9BURK|nr:peptide MFS transporter [Roseateles oligotrophus]MBB4842681.1 POT family proton-dependent oligopeptide transporter [Roseateles oligotrophus]